MTKYDFRNDADGIAHVCPVRFNTALCGKETVRPAGERGVPCRRCLQRVTDREAAA